jgi:hypothetical protein
MPPTRASYLGLLRVLRVPVQVQCRSDVAHCFRVAFLWADDITQGREPRESSGQVSAENTHESTHQNLAHTTEHKVHARLPRRLVSHRLQLDSGLLEESSGIQYQGPEGNQMSHIVNDPHATSKNVNTANRQRMYSQEMSNKSQ